MIYLVQTIPQETLLSVCLDQQCVPGPGPSQCDQNTWEAYVGHEREGKTCRSCCVSEKM